VSGHDHDHDDPAPDALALRAEALESLLVERGVVTADAIDRVVERYEREVGPLIGARVVARAWVDPAFRRLLLSDAHAALAKLGIEDRMAERIVVLANEPGVHNVVVCTLCSCYPWALLGLPPGWYKDFAYRSRVVREPRAVLREMGLDLGPDVEVRVWDSSAELRYLVLPERPAGTAGLDEAALAALVTRDSMIGVARAREPERG
jgi:nitrile hydratase